MACIGECARSGSERVEELMEAEIEQTQDEVIWNGGPKKRFESDYSRWDADVGCALRGWRDMGSAYPILCSAMSGNGWNCEPRTLEVGGTQEQQPNPNRNEENVFCPGLVSCSCQKVGHSGDYTQQLCHELMGVTIDHQALLQQVEQEVCPAFAEACEEDCDSSWLASWVQTKEKCVEEECSVDSCLDDFPRYTPEFMTPYDKKDVGCWGRLKRNGKVLNKVLHTIKDYESLAKCCFRQGAKDGANEFKWMSGNELVKSMHPGKFFSGTKICNTKEGWHSASHVGDGSTQAKCESLR
jgi:hypothetical protein